MKPSQDPWESRLKFGCIAVILLALGVDIALALVIYLLARTYW